MAKLTMCLAAAVLLSLPGRVRAEEEPERGWMGVQVRELTEGESEEPGVYVLAVVPESPAAAAGIRAGDVLFFARGQRLGSIPDLIGALRDSRPGDEIGVALRREGEVVDFHMKLGEFPEELAEEMEEGEERGEREEQEEAESERERLAKEREVIAAVILRAAREGKPDLAEGYLEKYAEVIRKQARLEWQDERGRGGREEAEAFERQVEVLRLAMKVLLDADREDAGERIEQYIHALELRRSGRRDGSAERVIGSAPRSGQMAELLLFAAELCRKEGMPDRADICERLGRHFQERYHAERAEREAAGGAEAERKAAARNELAARVRQMEEEVAELRKAVAELEKRLK